MNFRMPQGMARPILQILAPQISIPEENTERNEWNLQTTERENKNTDRETGTPNF